MTMLLGFLGPGPVARLTYWTNEPTPVRTHPLPQASQVQGSREVRVPFRDLADANMVTREGGVWPVVPAAGRCQLRGSGRGAVEGTEVAASVAITQGRAEPLGGSRTHDRGVDRARGGDRGQRARRARRGAVRVHSCLSGGRGAAAAAGVAGAHRRQPGQQDGGRGKGQRAWRELRRIPGPP